MYCEEQEEIKVSRLWCFSSIYLSFHIVLLTIHSQAEENPLVVPMLSWLGLNVIWNKRLSANKLLR